MDNIKDDSYYIEKIKSDIRFIIMHMQDKEIEDLEDDELLQDSMMFRMVQISENAKKLTEAFKNEYTSVPWDAMIGLRNRIVHDYGNVDLDIVFETLKYDIPLLLKQLGKEL